MEHVTENASPLFFSTISTAGSRINEYVLSKYQTILQVKFSANVLILENETAVYQFLYKSFVHF